MVVGLTSCKRFAMGFDLEYCNTLPFGIHSVRMKKRCGLVEIETPSNGKMLGCDKCFQAMISRHIRWEQIKRW